MCTTDNFFPMQDWGKRRKMCFPFPISPIPTFGASSGQFLRWRKFCRDLATLIQKWIIRSTKQLQIVVSCSRTNTDTDSFIAVHHHQVLFRCSWIMYKHQSIVSFTFLFSRSSEYRNVQDSDLDHLGSKKVGEANFSAVIFASLFILMVWADISHTFHNRELFLALNSQDILCKASLEG